MEHVRQRKLKLDSAVERVVYEKKIEIPEVGEKERVLNEDKPQFVEVCL